MPPMRFDERAYEAWLEFEAMKALDDDDYREPDYDLAYDDERIEADWAHVQEDDEGR